MLRKALWLFSIFLFINCENDRENVFDVVIENPELGAETTLHLFYDFSKQRGFIEGVHHADSLRLSLPPGYTPLFDNNMDIKCTVLPEDALVSIQCQGEPQSVPVQQVTIKSVPQPSSLLSTILNNAEVSQVQQNEIKNLFSNYDILINLKTEDESIRLSHAKISFPIKTPSKSLPVHMMEPLHQWKLVFFFPPSQSVSSTRRIDLLQFQAEGVMCLYNHSEKRYLSICSSPCGKGYRFFTYGLNFGNSATCNKIHSEECNPQPCNTDCVFEKEWTEVVACSAACDATPQNSVRIEAKKVLVPARGRGKKCHEIHDAYDEVTKMAMRYSPCPSRFSVPCEEEPPTHHDFLNFKKPDGLIYHSNGLDDYALVTQKHLTVQAAQLMCAPPSNVFLTNMAHLNPWGDRCSQPCGGGIRIETMMETKGIPRLYGGVPCSKSLEEYKEKHYQETTCNIETCETFLVFLSETNPNTEVEAEIFYSTLLSFETMTITAPEGYSFVKADIAEELSAKKLYYASLKVDPTVLASHFSQKTFLSSPVPDGVLSSSPSDIFSPPLLSLSSPLLSSPSPSSEETLPSDSQVITLRSLFNLDALDITVPCPPEILLTLNNNEQTFASCEVLNDINRIRLVFKVTVDPAQYANKLYLKLPIHLPAQERNLATKKVEWKMTLRSQNKPGSQNEEVLTYNAYDRGVFIGSVPHKPGQKALSTSDYRFTGGRRRRQPETEEEEEDYLSCRKTDVPYVSSCVEMCVDKLEEIHDWMNKQGTKKKKQKTETQGQVEVEEEIEIEEGGKEWKDTLFSLLPERDEDGVKKSKKIVNAFSVYDCENVVYVPNTAKVSCKSCNKWMMIKHIKEKGLNIEQLITHAKASASTV